jgi:DNA-binding NarL/FixJ family response regulator
MKFDFTKEEYETLKDKMMLNDELSTIFEMKIKGCSIIEMSMELHLSESTIKRRIRQIKNKLKKVL